MAETPKPLTVRQLLVQNKTVLRSMLKNGHSCADVATVCTEHNVQVSNTTVKNIIIKPRKKNTVKEKENKAIKEQADALLPVSQEQASAIIAEWTRLSTVRKGLTKQALVIAMKPDIDTALEAGYSYDDIAGLMAHNGVTIAVGSLKKYHRQSLKLNDEPDTEPQSEAPPRSRLPQLNNATSVMDEEFYDD